MTGPLPVPEDFDAYWEAVVRAAEALPLQPAWSAWEPSAQARLAGVACRRVALEGAGGVRVGGILQLPDGPSGLHPGRRPGLLHLAGYGGELILHQDLTVAGFAVLDWSHRGMRLGSEGFDRAAPRPLLSRDVEDRERYAYRDVYQDCLLGLRLLRSLPGIDPERVGVLGTSQGGGLAIGLGVLGGVRAVAADIPWLTHFARQLAEPVEGPYNELKELLRVHPELEGPARRTLAYFDTLSFAPRLRVPALVSLGQADRVCPPDSVRALFERLGGCKALLEVPGLGHERSALWRRMACHWMQEWL
jgi:cephalosporin-C deacetylase